MQMMRVVLIALLAGSTIWAGASTYRKSGVRTVTHPEGISLRNESAPIARGGALVAGSRAFRGGGLARGK